MKYLVIALFVFAASLQADPLVPGDFASAYPLQTAAEASIYRLDLPIGVYTDTTRPDLGDVRVFNAANEVVPHTLHRPAATQATDSPPRAVRFFPLETQLPDGQGRVALRIQLDAQGTVLALDSTTPLDRTRFISAYLLDIAAFPRPPDGLDLTWTGGADTQVLTVDVSGSDDLSRWAPLSNATLLHLTYAGHQLERHRIELPPHRYKYLRLSWPGAAQHVQLTGVQAHIPRGDAPRLDQWLELAGRRIKADRPVYEYDSQAFLPIERIDLMLAQNNSLLEGTLLSRANAGAPWTLRYRGVFYRLREQEAELHNELVSLGMNTDRYWRLEVGSDPAGLGDQAPVLRIGWVPHTLYFLARGPGPFKLAYGAAKVKTQAGALDLLLARVEAENAASHIGIAKPGARITLGGPSKRLAMAPSLPWQRIILWSVLVLGVLLLGGMAWRLYGQMNGKGPARGGG